MTLGPDTRHEIAALVTRLDQFPIASLRCVIGGLLRIINDPGSSARDLKQVIEIDPPLAGKVLAAANSPVYGVCRGISDIEQAVIWIGFDTLKEIALSQVVGEFFWRGTRRSDTSRLALWRHSVAVALAGKLICRREFGERGENAYALGLMHDIGVIAIDQLEAESFQRIQASLSNGCDRLVDAEASELGFTHADFGRAIAEHWDFPDALSQSIGFHHEPLAAPEEHRQLVGVLHLADLLACSVGVEAVSGETYDGESMHHTAERLGIEPVALQLIVEEVTEALEALESRGLC